MRGLATRQVPTAQIQDGAVTEVKMADDATLRIATWTMDRADMNWDDGGRGLPIFAAPFACNIVKITMTTESATTSTGLIYWEINIRNRTQAQNLRNADYNTDTDGDFVAFTELDLGLDQNLGLAQGDVLSLDLDATGYAAQIAIKRPTLMIHYRRV